MIRCKGGPDLFKDQDAGFAIRVVFPFLFVDITHLWIDIAHISPWIHSAIDVHCFLEDIISAYTVIYILNPYNLINIIHGVIYIKVPCRGYKPVSLEPLLLLEGLVIVDYNLSFFIPYRDPYFIPFFVIFKVYRPSVITHLPAFWFIFNRLYVINAYTPVNLRGWI